MSVTDGPFCGLPPAGWECTRRAGHEGPCAAVPDHAVLAALRVGEDSHLLTVGSPSRGLALRVTLGRLSRGGYWHPWQPCVFLLWRGKRL